MTPSLEERFKPLGLIQVSCPSSLGAAGLVLAQEEQARVHAGPELPGTLALQSYSARTVQKSFPTAWSATGG
jgi:hypothetical protein